LEGVKFLIAQPLDKQRRPKGEPVVAADATAQAGPGELVFIVGSREAALALPTPFVPVDDAIVGIVDLLDVRAPVEPRDDGDGPIHRALPACTNAECADYDKTEHVIRHGRTRNAVQRYRCKTCGNTFTMV
jgi:ethanolamine utilization protein EutN